MTPAASDFLPAEVEVRRGRRRTVELSLEHGRLVARVPRRIGRDELTSLLESLRDELWTSLRRKYVFDDASLRERAHRVATRHLRDLDLPPFEIRFSRRQRKRWGSCTTGIEVPRIRINAALIGHPAWVLDQVLLHELIHLVVPDHGERFHDLMQRSPRHERAEGYLEALENLERMGSDLRERWTDQVTSRPLPDHAPYRELPLFAPDDDPSAG